MSRINELDNLEEKQALKQRLKSQKQNDIDRKLTDKERKGQSLENLRKKREKKQDRNYEPDRSDRARQRTAYTSSEASDYEEYESKPQKVRLNNQESFVMSYQDALSIQVKRDDVENWLHKPSFEKTLKGCLVRISLGAQNSGGPVYRCCYVTGTDNLISRDCRIPQKIQIKQGNDENMHESFTWKSN